MYNKIILISNIGKKGNKVLKLFEKDSKKAAKSLQKCSVAEATEVLLKIEMNCSAPILMHTKSTFFAKICLEGLKNWQIAGYLYNVSLVPDGKKKLKDILYELSLIYKDVESFERLASQCRLYL